MARGSFILLSRLLVAGTAFIVLHITSGFGLNIPSPPGRTILGGEYGVWGMTLRISIMLTGFTSGLVLVRCVCACVRYSVHMCVTVCMCV